MNTYLVPYYNDSPNCDILTIHANSIEECQDKIIEYYADKLDSDEIAGFTDYDEFLVYMEPNKGIYIGEIHELEEYES